LYIDHLKSKTSKKFRNVLRSDWKTVDNNLKILLNFLNENQITSSILEELRNRDCYKKEWSPTQRGMAGAVYLNLPSNDIDYAAISLSLLEKCSLESEKLLGIGFNISGESKMDSAIRYFNEIFTKKLMEYIDDQIEEGNLILYLLNKYKARCEWFTKKDVFKSYLNNPSKGEEILTEDLRKFLFDQGIDYPFSNPETPSGKPDLVHGIDGNNPMTLEIKLFEPSKGYNKSYIRKGFRQAFDYAEDYNQPFGYLLIFNLSDYNIKFSVRNKESITKVDYGDKTVFIVVVNLFDDGKSSSQRKKLKPYEITEEFLKSEDD
jgi:hypothetical protein